MTELAKNVKYMRKQIVSKSYYKLIFESYLFFKY